MPIGLPVLKNRKTLHRTVNRLYISGISETGGVQHIERRSILQDSFLTNSLPEFDTIQPQNVSALVGKTAFLTCVVRNLKPTQRVSYIE